MKRESCHSQVVEKKLKDPMKNYIWRLIDNIKINSSSPRMVVDIRPYKLIICSDITSTLALAHNILCLAGHQQPRRSLITELVVSDHSKELMPFT